MRGPELVQKWSPKYGLDGCRLCGRSNVVHHSGGLCNACAQRSARKPRPPKQPATRQHLTGRRAAKVVARMIRRDGWNRQELSIGATVSRATVDGGHYLMDLLRNMVGTSVIVWEAYAGRTQEQVLELLDRAAGAG